MPTPPLWLETQNLSEAVHELAIVHGLTRDQEVGAMVLLGRIIGEGEASHVRCLTRMADAMEHDRDSLPGMAAEHETRAATATSGAIGKKPEAQGQFRWDLSEDGPEEPEVRT